jgi:hypothetical protein
LEGNAVTTAHEGRSARLRRARIAAGFDSAAAAARFFGWTYPTYAQHEGGHGVGKNPARYARAFKVSETWLLTGTGADISPQENELSAIYQSLPRNFQDRLLEEARILRLAAGNPERAETASQSSPDDSEATANA